MIGAVALAAVVLAGALVRLTERRPVAVAQQVVQTSPRANPANSPSDQPAPFVAAPTDTPTPSPSPTPSPTPRQSPTPSVGTVTILDPRLQVRRGRRATLNALTTPHTQCQITVGYSPAPQLQPASSSGSGTVTWSWVVGDQVRPGIYPIQVTCGSATGGATITVS